MKIKPSFFAFQNREQKKKKIINQALLKSLKVGLFLFFLPGCFYFISPIRKAEKALKKGNCEQAREFFIESRKKNMKFAEKAGKLCQHKNLRETLWFYQYLSLREQDEKKSLNFKETLADLYFKEVRDYERALEVYFSLREKSSSTSKKWFYSFRMALSYYEMGKWEMSLKEIEGLLKQSVSKERIKVLFLKARTLLMQKKYKKAEAEFRQIKEKDFKFFKENNLFLYLSFIYESKKEFQQAVLELESFQSTSEFLANKIKRLKIRKNNQPGVGFGQRL